MLLLCHSGSGPAAAATAATAACAATVLPASSQHLTV